MPAELSMSSELLAEHYDNWVRQDIVCNLGRHDQSIPITEVDGLCNVKGELGKRYKELLLEMTEVRGDRRYLKEVSLEKERMH